MNSKKTSSALILIAVACPTVAQIAPDAGQVLRETAPTTSSAPAANVPPAATGIQPTDPARGAAAQASAQPEAAIAISSVRITGSTVFTEDQLLALVPDLAGTSKTLSQLQQAVARISRHYRAAGYLVARAYLPPQKLEDGALTIAVLEGQLSGVKVANSSRLTNEKVEAFLAQIPRDTPPQSDSVNRAVLLLGDVPGVAAVNARLSAGAQGGQTVLNVDAGAAPLAQGRLEADNFGGLYTGRYRLGGSLNLNSALGWGERLSARLLASNGDLVSGRLANQLPLGSNGLSASAALSRTTYELGDVFKALEAGGRSDTVELSLRYPLLRTTVSNLYASLQAEQRDLRDEVRSTATVIDKSAKAYNLSLHGDWRDNLGGGGVTLASLTVTSGKLNIDSTHAAELDAAAAKTAGNYSKWGWSVERQQALARNVTLSVSARGQNASKNLDSSEKFSLGGHSGVRAYSSGEASGDEGWLSSVELRYGFAEGWSASVFHDAGMVKVNDRPYLSTPNTLRRSGTGLGLQGSKGALDWQLTLAWRGSERSQAEPDKNMRIWAQAGWRF